MSLSREDILHLAKLARMTLTDAEVDAFTPQLSAILDYVGKLEEVEVDVEREAVANISGLENVLREDVVRGCSDEERQRILMQFPLRQDDLLKTPGALKK